MSGTEAPGHQDFDRLAGQLIGLVAEERRNLSISPGNFPACYPLPEVHD